MAARRSILQRSQPRALGQQAVGDSSWTLWRVTLKLNRLALRLLKTRHSIEMCVQVRITQRRQVLFAKFETVTLRP
jgi:hypothetical protein